MGFGTAAETQQVEGMNLMVLGQNWNVVAPVVGGRPESMHQQQRRAMGMVGCPTNRVDRVALIAPARLLHGRR